MDCRCGWLELRWLWSGDCCWRRWMWLSEFLEEEARPARVYLEWEKSMVWAEKRGMWGEFDTWGVDGAGMWPRWSASGSGTDLYRGDSASCRAGGVADLGWIITPGLQGGRWESERAGYPRSPYVSALPTLSRSPGTSGLQLEPPMALPSTGRAGVGSRVCTGTA